MLPTEKLIWLSLTEPLLPVGFSSELCLQGTIKTHSAGSQGGGDGHRVIIAVPQMLLSLLPSPHSSFLACLFVCFCVCFPSAGSSLILNTFPWVTLWKLPTFDPTPSIFMGMETQLSGECWIQNIHLWKPNKPKNNLPPANPTLRDKSSCWYPGFPFFPSLHS